MKYLAFASVLAIATLANHANGQIELSEITSKTVKVQWPAMPNVQYYIVDISNDDGLFVSNAVSGSASETKFTTMVPGKFTVKLVCFYQDGTSNTKYPEVAFVIPEAGQPASQIELSEITSKTVKVQWPAMPNVQYYIVDISNDDGLFVSNAVTGSASETKFTTMVPGKFTVKLVCFYQDGTSNTKYPEVAFVIPEAGQPAIQPQPAGTTSVGERVSACGGNPNDANFAGTISNIVAQGADGSLQVEVTLDNGKKVVTNMAATCSASP